LISDKNLVLEAILVTHGHFDHVEGVAGLAEATGAKVYCSAAVIGVLKGDQGCSASGLPVPALNESHLTVIADTSAIQVGTLAVSVIETPGHTPGDVTYEIQGSLFCGDLLFSGSVGRTDFPGGDFGVLLQSLRRLIDAYPADTRVYPGHMEATTLGRELKYNPFLEGLRSNG
jgi:glyoxylase-like metal-dependent hydrolase (beta-lactamase superfamily II)